MAVVPTILLACVPLALQPFSPAEDQLVRATAMLDHDQLTPGGSFLVAVEFRITPGWHIYWDGLNDTGVPTRISLEAPDGFEVGGFRWPAPTPHELDGGQLDYVFEDRVVALAHLRAPDTLAPGSEVTIRGRARWLVCQETCIPGDARFTLTLGVGPTAQTSIHASVIERAAELLPVDLADVPEAKVHILFADSEMWVSAADATDISFYPSASCVAMVDRLAKQGRADGSVGFEFDRPVANGKGVQGILEVRSQDQEQPHWYRIGRESTDSSEE